MSAVRFPLSPDRGNPLDRQTFWTTSFRERIWRSINLSMMLVALAALVSFILDYGQYLPARSRHILQIVDVVIVVIFISEMFLKLLIAQRRWEYFRTHFVHFIVIALLVLQLLAIWKLSANTLFWQDLKSLTPGKLAIVIIQIVIGMRLLMEAVEAQRRLARVRIQPAVTMVGSFLVVIVIGTALLYSPRAVPPDDPRGHAAFTDALFTATSSICVTGLTVRETGSQFSTFGQGVILVLIQIGGLGLMTFAAFFALVLGRGLQLPDNMLMRDVLSEDLLGKVGRTVLAILLITFTCEALGAVLLYPVWLGDLSTSDRVYFSVFHSVSAFCNAGFSLFPDNFSRYVANWRLNLVVCSLIVVGGIGFSVQSNLLACLRQALRRLFHPAKPLTISALDTPRTRLALQTRIVLVTTACLILAGALGIFLLERNGQLSPNGQPMPLGHAALASLFQSVTARTAGFNTLSIGALSTATLFLLSLLMFIGASPGSTGGGIKTSTFALLVLNVRTAFRGRDDVETFHRTVPRTFISRVTLVLTLALAVVALSTFLLSVTERDNPWLADSGNFFMRVFFESMSAFGTVGLSTGLTPYLTSAGKIVIVLTMLVGRIGQLALLVYLAQRRFRQDFSYPEERLLVG